MKRSSHLSATWGNQIKEFIYRRTFKNLLYVVDVRRRLLLVRSGANIYAPGMAP